MFLKNIHFLEQFTNKFPTVPTPKGIESFFSRVLVVFIHVFFGMIAPVSDTSAAGVMYVDKCHQAAVCPIDRAR